MVKRMMKEIRREKEIRRDDYNLEAAFSRLCQEAERADRQALLRFRSWFKGLMDPAEDQAYTDAVRACTGNLKEGLRSESAG